MKIIFSRKGFDSAAGKAPSPIIEQEPISLPIPTLERSCGLQKSFSDLKGLTEHPLFPLLSEDVSLGTVFPAIRKKEMHFYYEGGRVCAYKSGEFYTNASFLHGKTDKSGDVKISLEQNRDVSATTYLRIKENCRLHWASTAGESRLIASLFPHFSLAKCDLALTEPMLLDVEVRFPKLLDQEENQNKIDLLFLMSNGTMCFIEVKRTKDGRVRASEGKKPEVLKQLCRYRQCLRPDEGILEVYKGVLFIIGKVFGRQFGAVPKTIFSNVPLLFVGDPVVGQPKKGGDVWLRTTLQKADRWELDREVVPIDGCVEPVVALRKFFARLQ